MSSIQGQPSMQRQNIIMDSAPAKSEVAKVLNPNQTKATNMQYSAEASRQAGDIRPPGESKAQFTDNYNPASTILRSQETDQRESGDQKLKDNKDRHGKSFKHQMNPIEFSFTVATVDRIKERLTTLGMLDDAVEAVLNRMDEDGREDDLLRILRAVSNSSKSNVEAQLKKFLLDGL